MNILFVCHRLPYPPNRGGKIRPFNMIRHLSRRHSVVVASLAQSEQELAQGAPLKDHCTKVIADVLPPSQRWRQSLLALPTSTPSSIAYFRSARLQRAIDAEAAKTKFDLIFVHCAFVAQYVLDSPAPLRVIDFGDLDSGKWAEYADWKPFPLSRMYGLESRKLRAYERQLAKTFDRCSVTTEGEKEEFLRLGASRPCTVIPNGVDVSYFSPETGSPTKTAIVFLGRMDYFPNVDAVCYFAEAILPLIRREMPDVEFRIVGSNPARRIRELASLPNTIVTGHVPDVRDYVRDAAVTVAPLRIARGTQNKILESMAMGIPVVASPQAAKGIQAVPGRDLLVGDSPEGFADQVVALLNSSRRREQLAQAGRKQVESAHLWPSSMRILDSLLSDTLAPAGHLRQIADSR